MMSDFSAEMQKYTASESSKIGIPTHFQDLHGNYIYQDRQTKQWNMIIPPK